MSNSIDSNETAHLDISCLQKPIIIACGSESKLSFGEFAKLSPMQSLALSLPAPSDLFLIFQSYPYSL